MQPQRLAACAVSAVLALGPMTATAEIVYDNTTNPVPGGWIVDPYEEIQVGDEVTLEGINRLIISLKIGVHFATSGLVEGVRARLYDNTGPGGQPGTLLYDSGPAAPPVAVGSGLFVFDFMPNVVVPDTVIWTLSADAWPDDQAEFQYYSPPDIGASDAAFFWIQAWDGSWIQQRTTEGGGNLYARLEAVPAPGAAVLGIIGLTLVGRLRHRQYRGC